ncbi:M20 family metallopeptidase [Sedimentitalea sp. XS_ASV28]|uniref:M20 family metallopeptidase n=1 Tax=Sedimentitalea sp. XS_ASV28 TaxID=3241296 RepID=UPI00351113F6
MNILRYTPAVLSATLIGFCGATFPVTATAQADVQPAEVTLSDTEQAMIAWVDENRQAILDELEQHVGMNTGTENIAGLDAYRDLLQADLEQLGFETETFPAPSVEILTCAGGEMAFADNLVGTIRGDSTRRIFMNGHMDTVFPASDEFQSLTIEEDGTLKGPGVGDMKGGIVVMLNALRAVQAQGLLADGHITIAFNSDEEIGSLGSRELLLSLAKDHDIGLIYEPSPPGKMTRSRKGLGQARLKITGREAHAGANHEQGVSANLELAHKVIEIEKLTDYEAGSTVNTGTMSGGEKRNTIPGCAEAYIDMRYLTAESGEKLKNGIEEIAASTVVSNPDYPEFPTVESWVVLHRPAKPPHEEVDALIAQAMGLSKLLGDEPITETNVSGGGTDGSIVQSAGLPTIDGLGLNGTGIHSSREASTVDTLIERTKMAAIMLARQIQSGQ